MCQLHGNGKHVQDEATSLGKEKKQTRNLINEEEVVCQNYQRPEEKDMLASSSVDQLALLLSIYIAQFPTQNSAQRNMAPSRRRLTKFSVGRSIARVGIRSPSHRSKPTSSSSEGDSKMEFLGSGKESFCGDGFGNGNKVMVVVDTSREAMGALEWALSHTVQNQDTIVLLYVSKPSKQGQITLVITYSYVLN